MSWCTSLPTCTRRITRSISGAGWPARFPTTKYAGARCGATATATCSLERTTAAFVLIFGGASRALNDPCANPFCCYLLRLRCRPAASKGRSISRRQSPRPLPLLPRSRLPARSPLTSRTRLRARNIMKHACAVTILAQGAKKGPRLSHSKQGTFDNGRRDSFAAGPFAGTTPKPPDTKVIDAHLPPSPPQKQRPLAVSRGLQAKTRASPITRKLFVLMWFGAAARIGGAPQRGAGAPLAGMRPRRCARVAWIRCAECRAPGSHPSKLRLEPAPPSTRRIVARLANILD